MGLTNQLQRLTRVGIFLAFSLTGICSAESAAPGPTGGLARQEGCNVVWNSPGKNAGESMPCGGGDIGLNVWVENGDLLIYLSRSGAFDENNIFPKLGRLPGAGWRSKSPVQVGRYKNKVLTSACASCFRNLPLRSRFGFVARSVQNLDA